MPEPFRSPLTGFSSPMARHGVRVVKHTAAELEAFGMAAPDGKSVKPAVQVGQGFTVHSDEVILSTGIPYVIIDGTKVYKECQAIAVELAMQNKNDSSFELPSYMKWREGKPFTPPTQAPKPPPVAPLSLPVPLPAVPGLSGEAALQMSTLQHMLAAATAERDAALAKASASAAQAAKYPDPKDTAFAVIVPGFGTIKGIVDYVYREGSVLVVGYHCDKNRTIVAPSQDGSIKVTFDAVVGTETMKLTSFAGLGFVFGPYTFKLFLVTDE